jgi:hypothetical protein
MPNIINHMPPNKALQATAEPFVSDLISQHIGKAGIKQYFFLSFSLGVCQGLGADFCRKSEIHKSALWGRKAGTDRAFFFGSPKGMGWLISYCARPTRAF